MFDIDSSIKSAFQHLQSLLKQTSNWEYWKIIDYPIHYNSTIPTANIAQTFILRNSHVS